MIKESGLEKEDAVFTEVVPAGDYFMKVIMKDQIFRILDLYI